LMTREAASQVAGPHSQEDAGLYRLGSEERISQ